MLAVDVFSNAVDCGLFGGVGRLPLRLAVEDGDFLAPWS
jgi:hypothetical protein